MIYLKKRFKITWNKENTMYKPAEREKCPMVQRGLSLRNKSCTNNSDKESINGKQKQKNNRIKKSRMEQIQIIFNLFNRIRYNRMHVRKTKMINRNNFNNIMNKKIKGNLKKRRPHKHKKNVIATKPDVLQVPSDEDIEVIVIDDDSSDEHFNSNGITDKIMLKELPIPFFAHITIDGGSVASYGGKSTFKFDGIITCIKYFEDRGHRNVVVLLSSKFQCQSCLQYSHVHDLQKNGRLKFIPRRVINGKPVNVFDDSVLLEYASKAGGLFVSNNQFKNYLTRPAYKQIITERTLNFNFYGNMITFPLRPNGFHGPTLQRMLNSQYDPL